MNNQINKIDSRMAVLTTFVWILSIAAGLGWIINFSDAPTVSTEVGMVQKLDQSK